jgi:protein involved in polysaccharide export with SLBB domain
LTRKGAQTLTAFRKLYLFKSIAFLALVLGAWLGALAADIAVPETASQTSTENYALSTATDVRSSALSSYKLAAGDVISIRVLGEDEFTREKIRLTDAGTISFPAIGEIKVLGRTLGDLESIVVKGLKGRILVNPKVSVQIDEYRPFYVNGMVERPGGYPFQPGLTVRKAVSLAGGFKERAAMNKIFIIREDDREQKPSKVDLSTMIGPGDILTIEESFF